MSLIRKTLFFIFLFIFSLKLSFSQIFVRDLPNYTLNTDQLRFLEKSSVRNILLLNGKWEIYSADDEEKEKTTIFVPSIFEGDAELVFEKKFEITSEQLNNNNFELHLLALSYTAEISLNGSIIFRHTGGDFPFSVFLPKDLIKSNSANTLSIKINSELDGQNTIPSKHGFLKPENFGGIFRDVYIKILPNIYISNLSYNTLTSRTSTNTKININCSLENREFQSPQDSVAAGTMFEVKAFVTSRQDLSTIGSNSVVVDVRKGKDKAISFSLNVNPQLWSPSNPARYDLTIQIFRQGVLVDEIINPISFYSLHSSADSLMLNSSGFQIRGVTYVSSNYNYGSMMTYENMRRDIRMIKELGFNAVRFTKIIPHPYFLELCEEFGLFAFVELPLQSVPSSILGSDIFIQRTKNYVSRFLNSYKEFSSIAAIGMGTSFISNDFNTNSFISQIANDIRKNFNRIVYASFINADLTPIENLDFYGIEILNSPINNISEQIINSENKIGKGKVFISEAGYIANLGGSTGYTNPHTLEAQAKFFLDVMKFSEENNSTGFFLNTMFDYRTEYNSIVSGYSNEGIVSLGILGEDRNTNRISYKVIRSELNELERVTIPIGVKKDDSPMVFIVVGLVLALMMGFLVNTGRKFREDASRALLRPYNFFADIRDLRIISGIQTTVLGVVISAILALLVSSLLYDLKANIFLEKYILAFGNIALINSVSFLTWNPLQAIIVLSLLIFVKLLFISLLIKAGSFFVSSRVYTKNAYFSVVWSFLPFTLSIPLAIILYRLLSLNLFEIYLYLILLIFVFWSLYRLFKGIYVIYDVRSEKVYFYSFVIIFAMLGLILVYFQSTYVTIDYLIQIFKETKAL
ncbi:MAG: hypothetical protein C0425_02300 [Chlorobiaceae bacterium]|nr:hypothetical protein [Chlorobiaceae bacterium]MBA4309151.1 hypothetical protein [Chlorobiaceae bacterium]